MDINTLTQLIASVGFPIVACCFMGWYTYTTTKEANMRIDALNDKITDALNNNTIALQKLTDRLSDE